MQAAKGLYAGMNANGGVPQKEQIDAANDIISRGLNPGGFAGMKRAVLFEGASRTARLGGAGYNQQAPNIPQVQIMKTKSGETVRVIQLPNGKYQEVQ